MDAKRGKKVSGEAEGRDGDSEGHSGTPTPTHPHSLGVGEDVEVEGQGEQQSHPLLNDCILSNMFGLCPAGQLSNPRLVCKAWHERSLSRFRKSATLSRNLNGDDDSTSSSFSSKRQPCFVNAVRKRSEEVALELDPELMEKYNLRNETPFRNFRFRSWDLHSHQLRQSFWSSCGAWMRSLTLDHCFISAENVEVFDQLLFETTRNLEVLKLRNVSFDDKSYYKYYAKQEEAGRKNSVTLIRSHPSLRSLEISFYTPFALVYNFINMTCLLGKHRFPNLKKLGISSESYATSRVMDFVRNQSCRFLETFFNSMAEIRGQDPSAFFGITHFEITGLFYEADKTTKISDQTAVHLEKLRWPLRSLTLDLGAITEGHVLQTILSSCASTLVQLELRGTGSTPYENFPFGTSLPCLQVLKTRGPILPSIACLSHFPNLRVLDVLPWRDGEIIHMEPEGIINFVLPHLVTFKFQLFHPGTAANMKTLAKCMPNLKEISMEANAETFPELCSLYSNSLRKLEISVGADVDEYVLTGTRKSDEGKLLGHPRNIAPCLPNITNLIHLQEFRMHKTSSRKSSGSTKLPGELAFQAGFRRLPNLRCLKLFDAPERIM